MVGYLKMYTMKNLIKYLLLLVVGIATLSCQKDEEYTLTEDAEYPRIFCTWPEATGGILGSFSGQTGLDFTIVIQYTPYEQCEAVWYLDDVEYCRGAEFNYFSWEVVTHTLKVVVTTPLYETYREAYLKIVNPI